jgi:type VI secretion system protein ImpL
LWGNQGVRFTPAFLAGAGRLLEASESSLRDGEVSRFDLQATPVVGVQEIQLEIDGQQLVYKNGREEWKPFTWPGTGAPGARIQVISNSGVPAQVFLFPGRLGFLRMLEHTDRRAAAGAQVLEWRFQTPRNFSGPVGRDTGEKVDYKYPLRLGYRPVAGSDPLQLLRLRKLGLPNKICP